VTQMGSEALCLVRSSNDAAYHAEAAATIDRHFARRGHGEEFEMEARWIVQSLPGRAQRILDIGCGIGALFPLVGETRVIGVDYALAGLRQTRNRFARSRLACGDAASLPFAEGSFDAIIAQHVIEHMPDSGAVCRDWRRVLRANGRLIIVTPNLQFCDQFIFDDPTHVCIFSRKTLRQSLETVGFNVEFICTLGLPWFRNYHALPGGWRLRRLTLRKAGTFARLPGLRNSGQSLCCIARRSTP
jgi:SAM-dependent methyltransferase